MQYVEKREEVLGSYARQSVLMLRWCKESYRKVDEASLIVHVVVRPIDCQMWYDEDLKDFHYSIKDEIGHRL